MPPAKPTCQSDTDATQPRPAASSKYGKAAGGKAAAGGYGNMKKKAAGASGGATPATKAYPKSANFALGSAAGDKDEDQPADGSQSARASVRSWSATGGMREATFKKRCNSCSAAERQHAVGFAVVLQAAEHGSRPSSCASLDGAEPPPDSTRHDSAVALWLEQLIVKLEMQEAAAARGLPPGSSCDSFSVGAAATAAQRASRAGSGMERMDSVDLDALGGGWAPSGSLPQRASGDAVLQMGAVLGVATTADALARALDETATLSERDETAIPPRAAQAFAHLPGDTPDATPTPTPRAAAEPDVSDPPSGGGAKFGKLGGGKGIGGGDGAARAKLASWSESGGVREGAFKKARSDSASAGTILS